MSQVDGWVTRLRRRRLAGVAVFVGVSLVVAATAAVAVGAAGGAGTTHRSLRLVRRDPATVRGTGFRPRSGVRVTLVADRRYVSRTRTSGTGTFTITFSAVVVDRCTAWSLTAVQGAASVVVHGPKPECAPASTP